MAVYAAHLTRTLQGAPSVFALAAQDALAATGKPALRRLVEYLAEAYPDKCGWAERWYDELYLLLDCCLQYHYLKHYAASFSESFYGLLRVPVSSGEFRSGQRLPPAAERASLALLVLAPYLLGKLERRLERWRDQQEDGTLGKSGAGGDRVRRAAITVHTVAHFACEGARLVQLARYMTGASPSPTLGLLALGLTLNNAPPQEEHDSWPEVMRNMFSGNIGSSAYFPLVGRLVLGGAQYGAFAVQFLRWWEAQGALVDATLAPPLPPPPPPQRDSRCARYSNKCPLCLRAWRTPAVLPVSGYVFCYTCISRHLRGAGGGAGAGAGGARCPVTRLPAAERSLVRLYLTN